MADYSTVVTQEFIPRCTTALNNVKNTLVLAGLAASAVTVSMPDTTDLRWQLTARRFGKTVTAYIELTDASHTLGDAGRGQAIFTLWLDGNGTEITTSYLPGPINAYVTPEGLDALLAKLAELESKVPEIAVKIRAFLGL